MSDGNELVQVQALEQEVAPVVARAGALVITSSEDRRGAADFTKAVKLAQRKVSEALDPVVDAANKSHKAAVALRARFLDPLKAAEAQVKHKMLAYDQAVTVRMLEEQRRLQAQADEQARRERERLEKEAARLKTPELKEARLAEAASIVAPVVQVAQPEPEKGESVRVTYKAVIVNAAAVPREWWAIDQSRLDAFARSTRGAVAVAGVRFEEVRTLAVKVA